MLSIGEDIVEDLKNSLMTPKNSSKIVEIEPEEEPIVEEVVPRLSSVKEEEEKDQSQTFTSIELEPEDEFWD